MSEPREHVWIGYCDVCNGQHCVTIEKPEAPIKRRPHSSALARAYAEGLEAGRREMALKAHRLAKHELDCERANYAASPGLFRSGAVSAFSGIESKLRSLIPAAPEVRAPPEEET